MEKKVKHHKMFFGILFLFLIGVMGCGQGESKVPVPTESVVKPVVTYAAGTATPVATMTPEPTATPVPTFTPTPTSTPTPTPTPIPSELVVFSEQEAFYTEDILVELVFDSEKEGTIYYTLDGTMPTEESLLYEAPVPMEASKESSPNLYHLRAMAVYEDGTRSAVTAHTYFVGVNVKERYSTLIFSVTGDPAELTEEPKGIFYGDNRFKKGRSHERLVYIEALRADGSLVFEQFGGVRVYGGGSREFAIPSMKIYARKEYSPDRGTFPISEFQTPRQDKPDKVVKKYDKLVLRNGGDDFQMAMIRDELAQMLAPQAGFTDYESVLPALVYMNGEYYGLLWLHESYCDEYFQRKYGEVQGEFIVCEGNDKTKSTGAADDEIEKAAAKEYNALYKKYAYADLTVDATAAELNRLIDIENYLRYFAYNLYIGNNDWPQGNYKCYRYYPAEGEALGDGVHDGRWRYLLHDTDCGLGTYMSSKDRRYTRNDWEKVMSRDNKRYSPLFTALMKREDCRNYVVEYTKELMNTVFTYDNVNTMVTSMETARAGELPYFYEHLQKLKKAGDTSLWAKESNHEMYMEQILTFITERPAYVEKYLKETLGQ